MIKVTSFADVTRFDLARTLLGRGRYWTTCYRLGRLLVDSGCAHAAPELARTLQDTRLTYIVNTHTHEDHIGANGLLQARHPGLQILAHPLAVPILADPRRRAEALQPYRKLFWGHPQLSQARPVADGALIEVDGYHLRVIYTPGHSPDHLCLYEEQRGWLFSGDLFSGGKDRALREGYNIWQIIESLKQVAALPISRLFPGSAHVRENPASELTAKIAYLEELGARVLDLHQRGWSVNRIVRRLLGWPMWVEVVTLGHFSRHNLIRSYLINESAKEREEPRR